MNQWYLSNATCTVNEPMNVPYFFFYLTHSCFKNVCCHCN